MKRQIEKCKGCGQNIIGQPNYGNVGFFAESAAKGMVKAIGDSIVPGMGTFANATGITSKLVHISHEGIVDSILFDFRCPCGKIWQTIIRTNEEHIPSDMLQAEKVKALETAKAKRASKLKQLIILSSFFLICIFYLVINDSSEMVSDHNWLMGDFTYEQVQYGWLGMALLAFFLVFPIYYSMKSFLKANKATVELPSMSLEVFKKSKYRLS